MIDSKRLKELINRDSMFYWQADRPLTEKEIKEIFATGILNLSKKMQLGPSRKDSIRKLKNPFYSGVREYQYSIKINAF